MTSKLPARDGANKGAQPALTAAARVALDVDPSTVIRQWLEKVAPGTRRKYQQAMRELGLWIFGEPTPAEVTFRFLTQQEPGPGHVLIEKFRDALVERGLAPGSVNGLLTGLGSLMRLARRLGLCSWNLERVGCRPERRCDRAGPGRQLVAQLLEHLDQLANDGNVLAIRDCAIIRLLHNVALRRAEVTELDVDHVSLDTNPAVFPRRKGKRERNRLHLPPRCAASLTTWIEERGEDPGPLFVRLDRARRRNALQRMSGESIRRLLAKRAREAGIDVPCRPHGMRHSSASHLAQSASVARLKAFGGWASLAAMSHYLDRPEDEQRAAAAVVDL